MLVYIGGLIAFVGACCYFVTYRPSLNRRRLRTHILKRAGSPTGRLTFTNGENGHFAPAGAIWLGKGDIAVGFDPNGQLARYLQLHPLRNEIWIDNIFGLEMAPQIVIADVPTSSLANSLRKILGRQLKQMTVLNLSDGQGQVVDFTIYPDHTSEAHNLVKKIGIQRSKLAQTES